MLLRGTSYLISTTACKEAKLEDSASQVSYPNTNFTQSNKHHFSHVLLYELIIDRT